MCKKFDEWSEQIEKYCNENGYDFEKAKHLSKSWGKYDLALQFHDPEKGKMGLLDETPAPVVLWVVQTPEDLMFIETEYTRQYLT